MGEGTFAQEDRLLELLRHARFMIALRHAFYLLAITIGAGIFFAVVALSGEDRAADQWTLALSGGCVVAILVAIGAALRGAGEFLRSWVLEHD
jgi:hypothetical protein